MDWTKCSDKIPDKSGIYLAVLKYDNIIFADSGTNMSIQMIKFATDMSKVKEHDNDYPVFVQNGPGWYDTYYNDEYGEMEFQELSHLVTHWMPLPELPEN